MQKKDLARRQCKAFEGGEPPLEEEQDHHPDIELGWGRVQISLMTHRIDGLSENDFILAARADEVLKGD